MTVAEIREQFGFQITTYQYTLPKYRGLWRAWLGEQRMAKFEPTLTEDGAILAAYAEYLKGHVRD